MRPTLRKNNKPVNKTILLEMLAKLPQNEQVEIYLHLGQRLKSPTQKALVEKESGGEQAEFLKTELGRHILEEADASVTLAEVRKALSSIKGNWAQDIIADREERF